MAALPLAVQSQTVKKPASAPASQKVMPEIYMGVPSNFSIITPYASTGQRATNGARLMFLPSKDYFLLYANGELRRGMPEHGLDEFDIAEDKQAHPTFWATYKVEDGKIAIRWKSNNNDFIGEFGKYGFKYQSDHYLRLPKIEAKKLEGTYKRADGMEATAKITFRRDGTFQESGIGPYIPRMDRFRLPGKGKYRLANFTLYLDYEDGRKRQLSCLITPSDAGKDEPEQIMLNTYELSRNETLDLPVTDPDGKILAKGDPPLTQNMADAATYHFAWLMDVELTSAQRKKMQEYLTQYWTSNNTEEIKNTLDALKRKRELTGQPQYVRNSARSNIEDIVPLWRKATDDPLSLYMAAIYDAAHKE